MIDSGGIGSTDSRKDIGHFMLPSLPAMRPKSSLSKRTAENSRSGCGRSGVLRRSAIVVVALALFGPVVAGCAATEETRASSSIPPVLRNPLPFVRPRPCPGVRPEWRPALEGTALAGLEARWRAQELSGGRRGRYDSRRGTMRWGSRELPAVPFAEWSEDGRWRWLSFRPEVSEVRSRGADRWGLELFDRDDFDVTEREAEILALVVAGSSEATAWMAQELGSRRTFFRIEMEERRPVPNALLALHLGICVDDLGLDPVTCLESLRQPGSTAAELRSRGLGVDERGDSDRGRAIWVESRWFEVSPPKRWSSFPEEVRGPFEPLIATSSDLDDPAEFVQRFHRTWCAWETLCAQLEVLRVVEDDREARWFEQQVHWLREASRELLVARWLAPGVAVPGQTSYHLVPRPIGDLEILEVLDRHDAGALDVADQESATAHRVGNDVRGEVDDPGAAETDRTSAEPVLEPTASRRGRWQVEARTAWGRIRYHVDEDAGALRIVGRDDRTPEDDDWIPFRF